MMTHDSYEKIGTCEPVLLLLHLVHGLEGSQLGNLVISYNMGQKNSLATLVP